jgi:hypothetical protein
MSAPAMKPDFAELTITALGASRSSCARIESNSSSTSRDKLLTEAPALSMLNHAMPSLSRDKVQCRNGLSEDDACMSMLRLVVALNS